MPKPNNTNNQAPAADRGESAPAADNPVKIKVRESSVAEFTSRHVPSAKEVEKFEEMINEATYASPNLNRAEAEAREEEIDESLNEIYQDDDGSMVNVREMDIKRKHGFLFWIFFPLLIAGSLGGAAYAAYHYFYLQPGSDATAVDLSIDGPAEVVAGEEFFYILHYHNQSNITVRNAGLSVAFPENYIFLDATAETSAGTGSWLIETIPPKYSGQIKIKGMIIAPIRTPNFISATLNYQPENFSSEFKKEATMTTAVRDIGIEFEFDYIKTVLVGDENELLISFRDKEQKHINNFRIRIEPQENIEWLGKKDKKIENEAEYTVVRPGVYDVPAILAEKTGLPAHFRVTNKASDFQPINIHIEHAYQNSGSEETDNFYLLHTETIDLEIMKSDLNLTLIINGSKDDQGIDFGDTLYYTLAYKNKGETEMKDVVVMAVLESDFLDWAGLDDPAKGKKGNNTLSWSKAELPALEALGRNEEGAIDFSINVAEKKAVDPRKTYTVKSYAQYSVGNKDDFSGGLDNRSNTITNKINSDLELFEQARYFSEDNIPVGTGPHPPKVGEDTTYKIYWRLENTLNELTDVSVAVKLPAYAAWDGKNRASTGSVSYDAQTREVSWTVGRLPLTASVADAEFSLKITPAEEDRNKIMVLLPGSTVKAADSETKALLSRTTKAKTTRLDDDDIAQGDGIVD